MKRLLVLFIFTFASSTQAQTDVGPIYDLTTTREDIKQMCKHCIRVSDHDTVNLFSPFLGLRGMWKIVFDSTGRHCESDWVYDGFYDTTVLSTILPRLTALYGKPAKEGGYINKATWYTDESVIMLVHLYGRDEVSVHWRFKSDIPIRWLPLLSTHEGRIDIETGRQFPPSIFDLTVTRDDLVQMCERCTTFVASDTVILWSPIAGVYGRYTLIFDSQNILRESNWTSHERTDSRITSRLSKHRGRDALKAVIKELSHFYGKPRPEEGAIKKVSWRQGETVATVTYLEQTGEIGVHYRFESDMPLTSILPFNADSYIDISTGLPVSK